MNQNNELEPAPAKHTLRYEIGDLSDGGYELYMGDGPLGNLCCNEGAVNEIVRRYNAHDRLQEVNKGLLEALKEILSEIQALIDDGTLLESNIKNHVSIIKANAAIAKATQQ